MEKTPFLQDRSLLFKFIIILLLVVIGFSSFSIIGLTISKLIWGSADFSSSPDAIRFFQTISTIGIFLFPALSFQFLNIGPSYFRLKRNILSQEESNRTIQSMGTVILLSILIIPLIGAIGEWNKLIHLPHSLKNIEEWMARLEEQNESVIILLTKDYRWISFLKNILVMAIIPAICEEFFFRGALQSFFIKSFKNKHIAILVTAIIFSIIHFQFYGFIPRVLLGVYLGYLTIWSGSLLLPILAHFLHNFLSISIDFISNMGNKTGNDIDLFEIQGIYLYLGIAALLVVMGIRRVYQNRLRSE